MELISGDHTLAPERYIAQQVTSLVDRLNEILAEAKAKNMEVDLYTNGSGALLSGVQQQHLHARVRVKL